MSEPTVPTASGRTSPSPRRGMSPLLVVALVLAFMCALSLVAVLMAAAGGHVIWGGFTVFPAIFLPVAFLLMCVELLRGARRRSAR
ncbi:hypothetical protein [Kocuria sp. KRD140]|uniref:hypothetical protein n=1 Tax=Kocuria sp. KRD140 TaxID=2729723 RepID=UPI0019CF668E|nr:hypothetical protein [Kocuria sp. KRD140]